MAKEIPQDRLFSEEHEWVKVQGKEALLGISDYAQHSLGDVVYVELPKVGQEIRQGAAIGVVESVKAVSDIYAPISGVVKSVNQRALDNPEVINQDPYGEGWLLMVEIVDKEQTKVLLKPEDYRELLAGEAK